MIGTQISHYRIIDKLGGGSMGVVYRAEDTRSGRAVAFKFLPFDLRDDPVARDSFVDEAQAASALDHPNICTIYDIGESENGRMFVAMAFYEGETLKKKLERGALDVDDAVQIVRQMANGLASSHSRGIVHRDIKPANVILTEDGTVKIVDFGLARVVSHGQPGLTQIGASMGTPTYMSPEQTLGDPVDERSDVWSLGVVFYECLTGKLPFDGANLPTVIQAIHGKDPVPPRDLRPEIPDALEVLVLRMLAKRPGDRPATCNEVLGYLDGGGSSSMASSDAVDDVVEPAASNSETSTSADSPSGAKAGGGCLALLVAPLLLWLL